MSTTPCPDCGYALSSLDKDCPRCKARAERQQAQWKQTQEQAKQEQAPLPLPVALQPVASQPVYIVQQVPNVQLIIDECTRQYKNLTWLTFAGIFLLEAYLIGLAMIIYAMVQKPALRRRIAELGVDPEQWELPLRAQAYKLLGLGMILAGVVIVLGLIIFAIISSATPAPTPEP